LSTPPAGDHLLLLAPAANRVYAQDTPRLAAAELAITTGVEVEPATIAGVDYLRFATPALDLPALAQQSAALALFRVGSPDPPLLEPLALPPAAQADDDLVTIQKYAGKTNEQFTRLLLNVTLSQVTLPGPICVLDPMCGRGTTLTTSWWRGLDAAGVEIDVKAVEALAAFLKTYLRRKRLKHHAELTPVRREGKSLGKRLDVEAELPGGTRRLSVFTGDTRQSAALWGKRRFGAVVVDAPYGVVHGSNSDVRDPGRRDRSAAALLREAIPVWARQLAPGGALGLSWNTLTLTRPELADILGSAGLTLQDEGPWRELSHRVDSSIIRDVAVARRL
jgi:SAM-dependent methyltransferase